MACIIIAFLLGRIVSKLLKIAGLGWANRLLGGLLGLVKGTLIVIIVLIILIAFLPSGNYLMKGSITVPYIVSGSKLIGAAIPTDIKSKYKSRIELFEMLKKSREKN
jgi:membrane protein required for colicin V production